MWEYRTINLSDTPIRVSVSDVLNDAGRDGWELVSVSAINVAYLKRQIAAAKPARRTAQNA